MLARTFLVCTLVLATACGSKKEGGDRAAGSETAAPKPAPESKPAPEKPKKSEADCAGSRTLAESDADARKTVCSAREALTSMARITATENVARAKGKPELAAATELLATAEAANKAAKDAVAAVEACHAAIESKAADASGKCGKADTAIADVTAALKKIADGLEAAKVPAKDQSELKDMLAKDDAVSTKVGARGPLMKLVADYDGCP